MRKVSKEKPPAVRQGAGTETSGQLISNPYYSNYQTETEQPIFEVGTDSLTAGIFTRLQPVQAAALDLKGRGFNVVPLPPIREIHNRAKVLGIELTKTPYSFIGESYKNTLHVCGAECERRQKKTGIPCMAPGENFIDLFSYANLGVTMGRLSGNLFAIDCDTQTSFKTIQAKLEQRNIKAWIYSGYKGGTCLLRLAEGEAANIPGSGPKNKIKDVEIWGNRHFIILPPSVHIEGIHYTWLTTDPRKLPPGQQPPLVTREQVQDLGVELQREQRRKSKELDLFGLPTWAALLSERNRELLAKGTERGERNNRFWAAACDLHANEIPEKTAREYILSAAEKSKPPYDPREAIARLNDAYDLNKLHLAKRSNHTRAKEFYSGDNTNQNTLIYIQAIEYANSLHWPGRTAQIDKAVFLACCERSKVEGNLFRATTREIAELANCNRVTATAALKRLRGENSAYTTPKLLHLAKDYYTKTDDNHNRLNNFSGNIYSITLPKIDEKTSVFKACQNMPLYITCIDSDITNHALKAIELLPSTAAEQDLFSALGRVSWQLWQFLKAQPQPGPMKRGAVSNLARLIDLQRSSVSKAIKRLINIGLVTHNRAENMLIGEEKTQEELERLTAISDTTRVYETFGRSEKRKRDHELQRARRLHNRIRRERDYWHNQYGK